MAGFMGVESLRSEIEQNLEWLYENNITYTKQVIDGSNIKDFVKMIASKLLAGDQACGHKHPKNVTNITVTKMMTK